MLNMKSSELNMKSSEIEWIGQIPNEWSEKPIRYLFDEIKEINKLGKFTNALKFTYGRIIPKENFNANDDSYVASTILTYKIVPCGTIMINCLNLNYDFISQRVGLVNEDGIITSAYLALYPKDKNIILSEYANYQFKSFDNIKAFHNMGTGVRKTLDFSELGKKYFIVPPLNEQKKIIAFLDSKCNEIDSLYIDIQSQIETLEEYKKSIITEVVTKGLNPNIEIKDSKNNIIGMIANDFNLIPLKYIVKYNSNSLPESTPSNYEFEYVDIGSVKYGKGIEEFQHMMFKDSPSRARRIVNKNDIILSTVRTYLKATASIPQSEYPIIVSTGFITLTANDKVISEYLKYAIQFDGFISEVESRSVGISYPAINSTEAVRIKVIIPPIEKQKEIAKYLDNKCSEIDGIITDKKKQLEVLEQYKKSIIYEYVTGKKEVI